MIIEVTEQDAAAFIRVGDVALKNIHIGGAGILGDVTLLYQKIGMARNAEQKAREAKLQAQTGGAQVASG